MKLSLRPLLSVRVLLTAIAVLFGILAYLGWMTFAELERQRRAPPDSAQWAVYQTTVEFHRLNGAFLTYRDQQSAGNLKELNRRFDIIYSRINTLQNGRALDPYREEAFFLNGMQKLTAFVERLAGVLDRREFERLSSDETIRQDFLEMEPHVAAFATSAVQAQAARNESVRSSLKRLLLLQLLTSGLVVLAFAYFAYVVLQQRNSALSREAALRESRDLLRVTVKSSLDSVLIADAQGNIVDLNDAAADMFGFKATDMTGREMSELIMPERHRPAHKAGMARYTATGKAKVMGRRIEIDAQRRDGTEFPIELSISSTGHGEDARYVAFMRDITDRRMAESSLRKAKEDAEAASRAKAQFLAAISHEMRTPLTGILGALDLMQASDLSEQQRRFVRTANRSGHALLSVISDVLDISRLEAGKVDIEAKRLNLEEIVGDVVEIVGSLAEERSNTISVRLDERLPSTLMGDPARIRQVLLNFATNAVKFTYGGSVTISARLLGRSGDRADVELSVTDTGPGISEGDQKKLFQNFTQIDNAASSSMGGSGLGLAISKRLVDLMSGTIGVNTAVNKGSRFWFILPLGIGAGTDAAKPEAVDVRTDKPLDAEKRILIVDDNETVRTIVTGQLAVAGHHAESAESAVKALSMMKSSSYDAVILDISMPVVDGFEALHIMRRLPGAAGRTPVIALTAHALSDVRDRCKAAGFDHFLTKPVRADDLAAVIREVTSHERDAMGDQATGGGENGSALFALERLRDQFATVAPADLSRIVERYGSELDQQLALLTGEGSDISPLHLRRIVHVLAGSSSMIGAERLGQLAGRLDALAIRQEDAELAASLDELVSVIRETRNAVEQAKRELLAAGA